jgi:hypothetical protein
MLTVGVLPKCRIKSQIPVSDMSRTPTLGIIKGYIPVSDLSRTPTVSIIKPMY